MIKLSHLAFLSLLMLSISSAWADDTPAGSAPAAALIGRPRGSRRRHPGHDASHCHWRG